MLKRWQSFDDFEEEFNMQIKAANLIKSKTEKKF